MNKKKYKRFPILLDRHTALAITVLSGYDHIEDMWTHLDESVSEELEHDWNMQKMAAKQLLDQLDEHYCVLFLEELAKECCIRLKQIDEKTLNQTDFLNEAKKKINEI